MYVPTVWALTTGEAGMRAQALGLAEALGFGFDEKRIGLRAPWRWLPGHLCPLPLRGLDASLDRLTPPWPDILISCGRRSTAAAIAIRKASEGRTFTVHLQHPRTPPHYFDLIFAHPHDSLAGANVQLTPTTIHRVTAEKLATERTAFAGPGRLLPPPLTGILLGGRTRRGGFADADIRALLDLLSAERASGASLHITPSRRTEPHVVAALRAYFDGNGAVRIWDGEGDNPYFGILASSNRLIVTADSTSMVSEALATNRPVGLFRFSGMGPRHHRFAENLAAAGHVSLLPGVWRAEHTPASNAASEAAGIVRAHLERRHGPLAGSASATRMVDDGRP